MPPRPHSPALALCAACAGAALWLLATQAGAAEPAPERAPQAVPREATASSRRAAPEAGQAELSHALGGLRRATAVPGPLAVELARRVLLDACRRDPALRSHWLCHDGS